MNLHGRGYLTMAVGRRHYLEMAVDMALSLRERSSLPILLASDEAMGALAAAQFPGVFSEIVPIERRFLRGRARKFGVAAASPFEETVFIDADCLVLSDPETIWAGAGDGPVTMVGEMLGPTDDRYHQGFSTRDLMKALGLQAYLKTNSGVFHFRRGGGLGAMEECLRCFEEEVRPALRSPLRPWRFLGDELGFALAGGRLGFHTFSPPGPMYWEAEIQALDPDRPSKPILHFIAPIPVNTLVRLLDDIRWRRHAAGLPSERSLPTWRREARISRFSWVANRALRRLARA
ncbi:MAG: hypothetical protein EXR92_00805 [Gemmatimonadetes bacterium]|nr:hypothetical protein [Gemmatimonadota bacterium]